MQEGLTTLVTELQLVKALQQTTKLEQAFWKTCILQSYGDYLAADVFIAVLGHTPSMADITGKGKNRSCTKQADQSKAKNKGRQVDKSNSKAKGKSETSNSVGQLDSQDTSLPIYKLAELDEALMTTLNENWQIVDKPRAQAIFAQLRDVCMDYNSTGGSSPWYVCLHMNYCDFVVNV